MKKSKQKVNNEYIEKKIYIFIIKKEINFENEDYFVLHSEFNKNHLLPKKYYKNYNLEIGKSIKCHIDKINCAGEVFLEPIHPFYKLNKIYKFKILRAGTHKFKKIIEYGLFVEDKFGNERFVVCNRDESTKFLQQKEILLKLLRIKKGIFWLQIIDSQGFA